MGNSNKAEASSRSHAHSSNELSFSLGSPSSDPAAMSTSESSSPEPHDIRLSDRRSSSPSPSPSPSCFSKSSAPTDKKGKRTRRYTPPALPTGGDKLSLSDTEVEGSAKIPPSISELNTMQFPFRVKSELKPRTEDDSATGSKEAVKTSLGLKDEEASQQLEKESRIMTCREQAAKFLKKYASTEPPSPSFLHWNARSAEYPTLAWFDR